MPGQMDRQLSLYSLMYVLLKGSSLSSWLKISFDPPLLLYSGEKTPFTCAEQDGGALEVVACKNAHVGCVCVQNGSFPLPCRGRAALYKEDRP